MKAAIFYFTMSGNTELAAKEVAEATGAPTRQTPCRTSLHRR